MSIKDLKKRMNVWNKEWLRVTSELYSRRPKNPTREVIGHGQKRYSFHLSINEDNVSVFVEVAPNIWSHTMIIYQSIKSFIKEIDDIVYLPLESKKILHEWIENLK